MTLFWPSSVTFWPCFTESELVFHAPSSYVSILSSLVTFCLWCKIFRIYKILNDPCELDLWPNDPRNLISSSTSYSQYLCQFWCKSVNSVTQDRGNEKCQGHTCVTVTFDPMTSKTLQVRSPFGTNIYAKFCGNWCTDAKVMGPQSVTDARTHRHTDNRKT